MAAINDLDKKTYYFMNESIMNITGWDINSHTLNAICIQDAETTHFTKAIFRLG